MSTFSQSSRRIATSLLGTFGATDNRPVALVTGAAGAMGRAIVERLTRAGLATVLVDLQADALVETARTAGINGLAIQSDLSQAASANEILQFVGQHIGQLDHIVNNAGLNRAHSIYDLSVDDWDAVMAVNLRAPFLLCQAAIPLWSERGGGSVVNIGSRVWLSGSIPAYTASKAGIVGLTRSLAVELGRLNVRANAVAPSFVDTPFTRQTRDDETMRSMTDRVLGITPLGRVGTADDIANAVAFLISDEASFITGEVLHVCGGAQLASQSSSFVPKTRHAP